MRAKSEGQILDSRGLNLEKAKSPVMVPRTHHEPAKVRFFPSYVWKTTPLCNYNSGL